MTNTNKYVVSICLLIMAGLSSVQAQWTQTFQNSFKVTTFATRGPSLFAGTVLGLFYSTDYGGNWQSVPSLARYMVFSMAANDTDLFAGTGSGAGLFLSSNNDTIWTPVGDLRIFALCRGLLVSHSGIAGRTLFLGLYTGGIYGGETLYRSTDNGKHWAFSGDGLPNYNQLGTSVECLADDGLNLFASMYGLGIFRSIDHGGSWSHVGYGETGLTHLGITALLVRGGYVFVGTGGGIFRSSDHGSSWKTVNGGLAMKNVLSMTASDSNLFAGTLATGMWKRPLSEIITSVWRDRGDTPTLYTVEQNFPNPFNPSATIRYELTKGSTVSLKIFNTLGQLVVTLVDAKEEVGYHQVQWSPSNVPSEIYFYRLQAGGFVETRKMILLR